MAQPRTPSQVEPKMTKAQEKQRKRAESIVGLLVNVTLDVATNNCQCSVCKTVRNGIPTLRAILNLDQIPKSITVN